MKKIILGIIAISAILFGANVSVVASKPTVTSPISKGVIAPTIKEIKNVEKITFKKSEPVQLMLKVPVDLEEVPSGIETGQGTTTGVQYLQCFLRRDTGHGDSWDYRQDIPLHSGQYTIEIKFNGIALNKLLQINAYNCTVVYKTNTGKDVVLQDMPFTVFENIEHTRIGGLLNFEK